MSKLEYKFSKSSKILRYQIKLQVYKHLIDWITMAPIQIPYVSPFWEHPGKYPRKLSSLKLQIDTLISLTDKQLLATDKLTNLDKNNGLHARIGSETARRFEHNSAMSTIGTKWHTKTSTKQYPVRSINSHVLSAQHMQTCSGRMKTGLLVKTTQLSSQLRQH